MPSKAGCGLEIFSHSGFRPSLPPRTKSSTEFTKTEFFSLCFILHFTLHYIKLLPGKCQFIVTLAIALLFAYAFTICNKILLTCLPRPSLHRPTLLRPSLPAPPCTCLARETSAIVWSWHAYSGCGRSLVPRQSGSSRSGLVRPSVVTHECPDDDVDRCVCPMDSLEGALGRYAG